MFRRTNPTPKPSDFSLKLFTVRDYFRSVHKHFTRFRGPTAKPTPFPVCTPPPPHPPNECSGSAPARTRSFFGQTICRVVTKRRFDRETR